MQTNLDLGSLSSSQRRCAFHTLGCKLNFSESSEMSRHLVEEAGFVRVSFDDPADVYVINTCSVTEEANRKCRQMIGRCRRINPSALIVVTGCYAQLQPRQVADIDGVGLVLGNNEKHLLVSEVLNHLPSDNAKVVCGDISRDRNFFGALSGHDRTRAFLKVQDGCDYYCAYCTIPFARGHSRSASISETVDRARQAAADGAKEIVLTGVNVGEFGKDSNESLLALLQHLDDIEGIQRYRISSIEPNLLTDEILLHAQQSTKLMPHFHLPLQSGSDSMLRLMKRRYDSSFFAEKVARIKSLLPDAFIGIDVIVGVNGETPDMFEESRLFLSNLPFSQLHVFTYSERPGTLALSYRPVVDMAERHHRNAILHAISEQHRIDFYRSQIGRAASVLVESSSDSDTLTGFTENYVRVSIPKSSLPSSVSPDSLVNTIIPVSLGSLSLDTLSLSATLS
ncbi:MAG: tRNA (N(6)-L-threonylcarbamoyladenosine(37)-C(2))-methylthiotransferase MtaB [Bacteroidales bacterium]|nr:tRNA (N(6)-L-threonylcarbamoyladenosine(37)-C(2))-methylthiotransferase MtaB [Bacteroidales bacterium]